MDIGNYRGKQTKHDNKVFKHTFHTCDSSRKSGNWMSKIMSDITKNLGWDNRECPIKAFVHFNDNYLPCSIFLNLSHYRKVITYSL